MERQLSPEEIDHWVTVNGKKIPVPKDKKPSKPSDPEAKPVEKSYIQRYDVRKSEFKIRDSVSFDEFRKSGTIIGYEGMNTVRIASDEGRTIMRHIDHVFKKSEMLGDTHWDAMTTRARVQLLNKSHVSQSYLNKDWALMPKAIQEKILKGMSPAGYGGVSTTSGGVYNPVNDNKSVSDRIREREKESNKEEPEEDKDDDAGNEQKKRKDI